ncbi:MAG: Omp28-related outer membrane protein [Bacteroidetes bacterium]|nr:Omp28-related outer membrane protein [Bacteroidota bacterium]
MLKAFSKASIFSLILIILFPSCKEIGPNINLRGNENSISDTTYLESPSPSAEDKNVVLEEFTGVRCPNCPQGHQIIETIKSSNLGRVISVSFHPVNSLGNPYPFSPQNFQSQKAQTIFDYLGQIGLEPAASVDRKVYSGESNILTGASKWPGYTSSQLALPTPVNISLDKLYDSVKNELTVIAELHYTQTITESNRLTILVTESGMIAPQLNGSTIDTFYSHRDVMRDFITNIQGDDLPVTLEKGRVIRKVYSKTLDALWKPENMRIVAFVHEFQNSKIIYQGKEVDIK